MEVTYLNTETPFSKTDPNEKIVDFDLVLKRWVQYAFNDKCSESVT